MVFTCFYSSYRQGITRTKTVFLSRQGGLLQCSASLEVQWMLPTTTAINKVTYFFQSDTFTATRCNKGIIKHDLI